MSDAMDWRTAPRRNDITTAFTDAVRENPVPAALIGMGALWLFMGGGSMTLFGGHGRSSVIGTAAHGVGSAAQGAAHMAERVGHAAAETASSIGETVSETAERASDYVSSSLRGGVDAEAAYHDGTPRMAGPRASLQDLFARHPVALGLAGIALGAGAAMTLPLTETERDTLGKAGEAVRNRLSETAAQAKDFTRAMAEEVRQA